MIAQLKIEELLGFVAVTTFLVGFSTVRLQGSLLEWRGNNARILDRLLQENAGADLLPIPTTLKHLGVGSDAKFYVDVVTWLSLITGLANFLVSVWLTRNELGSPYSAHDSIQLLHLSVVAIAATDVARSRYLSKREQEQTPGMLYRRLEIHLSRWLKIPEDDLKERKSAEEQVLATCRAIDRVIPSWCWLALIRSEVHRDNRDLANVEQDVLRIRRFARKDIANLDGDEALNDDVYSLVAYVWSSYLLMHENGDPGKATASWSTPLGQIEQIASYNKRFLDGNIPEEHRGDLMSKLALNCIDRKTQIRGRITHLDRLLSESRTYVFYHSWDPQRYGPTRARTWVERLRRFQR